MKIQTTSDEQTDITPDEGVEIDFSANVIWINIDGKCVLRINNRKGVPVLVNNKPNEVPITRAINEGDFDE